ncbi:MAG: hypothetical protein U9Q22_02005 [Candidatus Altiarchaeota archaeon]|nr:hypothetical protein [Candidatus Altiarchaeota archaeon]
MDKLLREILEEITPSEEEHEKENRIVYNIAKGLKKFEVNLGEGVLDALVYETKKTFTVRRDFLQKRSSINTSYEGLSIFTEPDIDQSKLIPEPKPLPDRAEVDNIILDELDWTKEERKEVYWSVCGLVKQRFEKVRSLRK